MTCQRSYFLHWWVFPNHNSVVGVAVGWDEFVRRFAEHQVAYLGAGVDRLQLQAHLCVPEFYRSVSCTSSTGQETALVWTPCDSLDSGFMGPEFEKWFIGARLTSFPDHQFVVISSRSQEFIVERPFKSAYLLLVPFYALQEIVRLSQVSV